MISRSRNFESEDANDDAFTNPTRWTKRCTVVGHLVSKQNRELSSKVRVAIGQATVASQCERCWGEGGVRAKEGSEIYLARGLGIRCLRLLTSHLETFGSHVERPRGQLGNTAVTLC